MIIKNMAQYLSNLGQSKFGDDLSFKDMMKILKTETLKGSDITIIIKPKKKIKNEQQTIQFG